MVGVGGTSSVALIVYGESGPRTLGPGMGAGCSTHRPWGSDPALYHAGHSETVFNCAAAVGRV